MAAEWDGGGYDGNAETVEITESAAADASYDIDPDTENYAAGNTPETAYRDQGQPDSPNGWSGYASNDRGEYAEDGANEDTEVPETDGASEPADLWGGTDPDAANYADLDEPSTDSPDRNDNVQQDDLAADRDSSNEQPDQAESAEADAERTLLPEQQRISALEAENADARQQIADLKADRDALGARLDRIEQLLARFDQPPDAPEHGEKSADVTAKRQDLEMPTIAEREHTDNGADTRDAEHSRWRHVTGSDNINLVGATVLAADTLAQLAVHATPDGIATMGGAVLVAAGAVKSMAEKRKKGKA